MVFCRGPGGNLPPNRMLCIRENEKTPEEKSCFLPWRFSSFSLGPRLNYFVLHASCGMA